MCILRYMPASRAVGVEHHGRVVIQPGRTALEQRTDDHHAVLARGRGQRLARRAGNRLGLVEARVIFALAGILPGKQFLQADDVRAGRGRFGNPRQRLVDVLLLVGDAAHLHQRNVHSGARRFAAALPWRMQTLFPSRIRHGTVVSAMRKPVGLFITGTDTDVGKTYVAAMIARAARRPGHARRRVQTGASGCRVEDGQLISDDAVALWHAAGSPGDLEDVCPQRFAAPLAPHLAAAAEGKQLDAALLRSGLDYWRERSDFVLVEGAGGLMSPLGDDEYVADLAYDFGFPLVVVARNQLGVINHTLQTLIAAATFRDGLARGRHRAQSRHAAR